MADEQLQWFSTMAPEEQAHIKTKGWDTKPIEEVAAAATKAHYAAERLIGVPAEQVLRLPKDATDPTYQAAYDRIVGMGAPKDGSAYTFDGVKFKDGTALPEDAAAYVRDLGLKLKLPPSVVQGIAQSLAERADMAAEAEAVALATRKDMNSTALNMKWGQKAQENSFYAQRAFEAAGFSTSVLAHMATMETDEYIKNMDAAVALGQKMGEAALLKGGGALQDPTATMTAADAQAALNAKQNDAEWSKRVLSGDTAAVTEWRQLTMKIAGGRVAPQ